jgi:mRNA-decapping enzyme subunit 2
MTSLVCGHSYSLEDYRGFLLCVEPHGHKKREHGRVVATRSRPGPWERVSFQSSTSFKGKKIKTNDVLHPNAPVNIVSDIHKTALVVDQSGLVSSAPRSKKSTQFHVEYHQTSDGCFYLALKTSNGRYLGTTKSGKMVCNLTKGNRGPPPMCFFRVFARRQEFDDRRRYLPLGYRGNVQQLKSMGPLPTFDDVVVELCGRFLLSLPPEELQDANRLFFQIEQMWWFYEDHKSDEHSHLPHMDHQEFGRQVFRLCNLFEPVRDQYDALYGAFKTYLTSVPVFGVFIMNPTMNKVVLVKSYNGSWLGFPRGKVNQNEAEVECAVREAEEEIGVDLNGRVESTSFIRFKEGPKMVKLFLVHNVDERTKFETQTRKEIGNISWYELSKAKSLLPDDQWKHLNKWIKNKRKAIALQLKKDKKTNKSNSKNANGVAAAKAAAKANRQKQLSKANNWQQGWGMDALLTGVDGGGGMFIDEEYDDQGFQTSHTGSKSGGAKPQSNSAKRRNRVEGGETKRQPQTPKQGKSGSSAKRQKQHQKNKGMKQPVAILKRQKNTSTVEGWKQDTIFQGAKFGKFTFDVGKVLSCLPVAEEGL